MLCLSDYAIHVYGMLVKDHKPSLARLVILYVRLQVLKSDIDTLKSELQRACEMSDTLQSELDYVTSERQSLLSRIEEIKKEVVSSNRLQVGLRADRNNSVIHVVLTIHSYISLLCLITGCRCRQQGEGEAKNETHGDPSALRCKIYKARAGCERIGSYEQEVPRSIRKAKGEVSIKSTRSHPP